MKEGKVAAVQQLLANDIHGDMNHQAAVDTVVLDINYRDEVRFYGASTNQFFPLPLPFLTLQLGVTSLIWASWRGHTEIVRLLLACPGIDINLQNYVRIR